MGKWYDVNGEAHHEPYTGPMKGQHVVVPRPEPKPAGPKYQSFTIELTWNHGAWHANVSRNRDGETRYYTNTSVEALLDAQVAGWIGGYDD